MNKTIFLIVSISVLTLAVGTASSVSNAVIMIPTVLAAKKSSGGGAVPLTPIQTGNTKLDNQIQSFYNCIKKTGHTGGSKPEPSKSEVINCYFKKFGNGNNV